MQTADQQQFDQKNPLLSQANGTNSMRLEKGSNKNPTVAEI